MSVWIIFTLGACLAGFVQGLTGFAFALIAMSFWVWILPPQVSAPLVVFASLWCHLISLSKEQKTSARQNLILPYIVAGLIGVPLGTYLLDLVNGQLFKLILGIFLLVWCPTMYLAPQFKWINRFGRGADATVGFLGGILGGLGGFCGALPSAWVMLKSLPKQQQRYILRHFNFAIQLFTIMMYVWQSTIQLSHLNYLAVIIIAVTIPAILGAQLFYKISEQQFKHIVLSLLFASGAALTATSLSQML